jgi:hypothetical protein
MASTLRQAQEPPYPFRSAEFFELVSGGFLGDLRKALRSFPRTFPPLPSLKKPVMLRACFLFAAPDSFRVSTLLNEIYLVNIMPFITAEARKHGAVSLNRCVRRSR